MGFKFSKKGIERIIIKSALSRPYLMYFDSKIYYTPSKIEEVVLGSMEKCAKAENLTEFETALQNPDIENIFIGKYAAITSAALKKVLERNGLSKTIFCAFSVQ